MTDTKRRLAALDRLETPDVWERALNLDPARDLEELIELPARKRLVTIGVAFAVFAAAAAFAWQGFRPSPPAPIITPAAQLGTSYAEKGVPVTYETLEDTIQSDQPSGTFTQGSDTPVISQSQAVDLAWAHEGSQPERIVTGYLEWRPNSSIWKGGPVWVVSFQGGDVCVPIYGGPSSRPASSAADCAGRVETSIIDANTGSWVLTFSNGPRGTKGSVVPEEHLAQLFSCTGC